MQLWQMNEPNVSSYIQTTNREHRREREKSAMFFSKLGGVTQQSVKLNRLRSSEKAIGDESQTAQQQV